MKEASYDRIEKEEIDVEGVVEPNSGLGKCHYSIKCGMCYEEELFKVHFSGKLQGTM